LNGPRCLHSTDLDRNSISTVSNRIQCSQIINTHHNSRISFSHEFIKTFCEKDDAAHAFKVREVREELHTSITYCIRFYKCTSSIQRQVHESNGRCSANL